MRKNWWAAEMRKNRGGAKKCVGDNAGKIVENAKKRVKKKLSKMRKNLTRKIIQNAE